MTDQPNQGNIHEFMDRRENSIKDWIREAFDQNNGKLLAQFSNMLHERDRSLLDAIHEQERNVAVMAEGFQNLKDEMRVYHGHNDKFKTETIGQIRALETKAETASGAIHGAGFLARWGYTAGAFIVGVGISVIGMILGK